MSEECDDDNDDELRAAFKEPLVADVAGKKDVKSVPALCGITKWLGIGFELCDLWDCEEVLRYVMNPNNTISQYVTDGFLKDFEPNENDVDQEAYLTRRVLYGDELRERLLVHIVAERISHYYSEEKKARGSKSGNIKRFFDLITDEPQSCGLLLELAGVSWNSVRNVASRDPFPNRGKVVSKEIDTEVDFEPTPNEIQKRIEKRKMIWREKPKNESEPKK
jgi:hypothetical protein